MKEIACGICSHWAMVDGKPQRVIVTHSTVAAVKVCAMRSHRAAAAVAGE
jgi:hypothetical protein